MNTLTTPSMDAIEQAKQELLAIHAHDRKAHFATDATALATHQADSFIHVGNGAVQHISREAMRHDFERYFKNATYYAWDDLEPPIVQVSQDASLGWMITRTRVRRTQLDETGALQEREFIYAGIMIYEKHAEQWVRTANVSTFENIKP